MSQKPKAPGHKASGAQAKPPEARKKSTHDDASGSKARSVSKENNRRDGVKKATTKSESKRSSSQPRKASTSQDAKKPGVQRDASRLREGYKASTNANSKAASDRLEGKRTVGTTNASSRVASNEATKSRDALKPQPVTVSARSPSHHRKESDVSAGRRQSRSTDKGGPVDPSSRGTSEKRPGESQRTKTVTAGRGLEAVAKSRHAEKAVSKGTSSTPSPKKQSLLGAKPGKTDERHKEQKSPYDKSGASKTARKTHKPQTEKEGPAAEAENKEARHRTC